jgi:hypothetical protein
MQRVRRWGLIALVLAAPLVAVPEVGAAAPTGPTVLARSAASTVVRDGAWVLRTYSTALASPTVVTYQGRAVDGGCRYGGTERVRPGAVPAGMVVVEREIGHDLSACRLRVERGLAPAGSVGGADGRLVSREAVPAGEVGPSTRASAGAFHMTYYEDPIGIDVTSVQADIRWSYDWSCVTNSWDHIGHWGWYTPSGWVRDDYSVSAYRYCDGATTIVYGLFHNTPFCYPYPATYNEYDVTVVKGQKDGSYWMQWNAYKWGGCNEMLSFHRTHGWI